MHLEREAEFGDVSWTREWPAGALFTSAQPVPHGIGMADQKISDPRILKAVVVCPMPSSETSTDRRIVATVRTP